MTRYSFSSIIFLVIFLVASYSGLASGHTPSATQERISKEVDGSTSSDKSMAKKLPLHPASKSEVPHGKAQAPVMEELPHIHRFHKERVKKIKQHHTKCWIASQVIVVLCHLSMLVIAYMHVIH